MVTFLDLGFHKTKQEKFDGNIKKQLSIIAYHRPFIQGGTEALK